MSELTVANRYAKSLIDLAEEEKALEAIRSDMELFTHTLKANSQLQAVLANPIIAHDKKIKILEAIFAGKVSKVTDSFFKIMINKSRAQVLYATAKEFINQYNVIKNIVRAYVTSATPLSEENKKQIIAELKASTGGTIELHTKVDHNLIGGFVLKVGDLQVDTSLLTSLKKLKSDFAHGVNQ
ncbi:ATP synthase F1 subunit delta [Mucilaginibacter ginsenosidivorans]|uniref:ATP synthase subunit delta n=1 Tax=Mucilaginibacter ginsenosidivorans TaxID=398053 RepID=A0A5B8V2U9_9SPHI|nr:ATP synthase F1 subunit delta [Mucilaginibacter ginsenosidivorans]QEC65488.1 ATP synthase F1 subunit delta [Mucilaginibacter ginsenosidivorans]